jgi:signal transduction histidine kinase
VVTLSGVLLLQWGLVSLAIRRVTEGYVAARLEHDLDSLLAGLDLVPDGAPVLARDRLGAEYQQPLSGHYYRAWHGEHVLRSRSLWDQDLALPDLAVGETRRLHLAGPAGQPLLVVAGGYRKQGAALTLAVAEDMQRLQADMRRFQYQYLALSGLAFGLLLVLQRYSVRVSLAPLEQVRETLGRLARGEVRRLSDPVPEEVRGLTGEVNHLLDLLGRRLEQSRTALGNLAHALKTPITLLLDLADDADLGTEPELRRRLREASQSVRELVDRELRRARLAGHGAPAVGFCPADELPVLIGALRQIHAGRGLDIACSAPPDVRLPLDRQDALELLGNLADNACKWARRRVRIAVGPGPGLAVQVDDDGPGCPPEQWEQLGQRGLRLDESTPGHGLGLAIVRDIVSHYGGRLRFDRSPELGGLRVQAELPAPG